MSRTTTVHFGLSAHSRPKAQSFYQSIFGFYPKMRSVPSGFPSAVVGVENLDDTLYKVLSSGGVVVREKERLPGIGVFAQIRDPFGNRLSLFQAPT